MLKAFEKQEEVKAIDRILKESRDEAIQSGLADTNNQNIQELLNNIHYSHMVKRLKMDLFSMRIKNQKLEENLNYKTKLNKSEENGVYISNERHIIAKRELKDLLEQIDQEQKQGEIKLLNLKHNIAHHEIVTKNRIESLKRRSEMNEIVLQENLYENEKGYWNKFYINKMWNQFLKIKMEKLMSKNKEVEMAFVKIKNVTGIKDVQEILRKFLTKENTYSQLLNSIKQLEEKILFLKNQNANFLFNLKEDNKQILTKSNNSVAFLKPDNNLINLQNEIKILKIKSKILDERERKCQIVMNQVGQWSRKIKQNIQFQLNKYNEDTSFNSLGVSKDYIEDIKEICNFSITKANQYIVSDNKTSLKQFFGDFNTDDFTCRTKRIVSAKANPEQFSVTQSNIDIKFKQNYSSNSNDESFYDIGKESKQILYEIGIKRVNLKKASEEKVLII